MSRTEQQRALGRRRHTMRRRPFISDAKICIILDHWMRAPAEATSE